MSLLSSLGACFKSVSRDAMFSFNDFEDITAPLWLWQLYTNIMYNDISYLNWCQCFFIKPGVNGLSLNYKNNITNVYVLYNDIEDRLVEGGAVEGRRKYRDP